MRVTKLPFGSSCLAALIVLIGVVTPAQAQSETFTATAALKGSGSSTTNSPITVSVRQYTSDGDRKEMLAALKKGMPEAHAYLAKKKDLGTIEIGGRQTPIKYAYAYPTPTGRLISIAAIVPIALPNAGTAGGPPPAGFDAGVIFLDLPTSAPASGQLIPTAHVRIDADGAILAEDASGEVTRLTNVSVK